ncbi:MAG TPA: M20/M25/M40 family metallo-hydrolase [Thermoanaerobaculia bacterium]|jgi:tripeptide aminopeptidase|nr:M20/M25/M40 family metallo-hydrolase [Thermoanaerobaculia bacterium]
MDDVDRDQALGYLLRFLAIEGTTGHEGAIGEEIAAALRELGIAAEAIRDDGAHRRIPLPTEAGNLVVSVPGDGGAASRLFVAHRDTVPLCAGARPRLDGDRVLPAGRTALGGDDRTGVACLLTMLATLRRRRLPHGPLTLIFTVREESGLWGARELDVAMVGTPGLAFNVDGSSPAVLTVGAVGAARWEVEITGRAAHAGLHPEEGISAPMVAALALAAAQRRGWFGRVHRQPAASGGAASAGTANVGTLAGRDGGVVGGATNVVTDFVRVEGEARSHDERFVGRIVEAYRRVFTAAAARLPNSGGMRAEVAFRSHIAYHPFRFDAESPPVAFARERAAALGLEPILRVSDGGLDANWLARHGIPAVTFGAGQRAIHTLDEHVVLDDYFTACRLAVALARA